MASDGRGGRVQRVLMVPKGVGALAWAQLISSIGTAMLVLAITFISYTTSESMLRTVLVTAAYVLPSVFFGLVAGRLTLSHDPARIVMFDNGARIVVYLGLAAVSAAGHANANTLLVFSLINGTLAALSYPAWQTYVHGLVEEDRLDELNASLTAIYSVGSIVGASVGGFLLAGPGATVVFTLNALSYIPMLAAVARTPSRAHPQPADTSDRGPSRREVLDLVRSDDVLRPAIVQLAMLSLLIAPVSQLLPAIADRFSRGADLLGALTAVLAAGSAAVAWRLGRLKQHLSEARLQRRFLIFSGSVLVILGLSDVVSDPPLLGIAVVFALFSVGLLFAMGRSVLAAIVQLHTDPRLEGAILAVFAAVYAVCSTLGGVVLAPASDHFNVFSVLAIAGAALCVFTVAHWGIRAWISPGSTSRH